MQMECDNLNDLHKDLDQDKYDEDVLKHQRQESDDLRKAQSQPKPVQAKGPPMLRATGGSELTLVAHHPEVRRAVAQAAMG